MSAQGSFIGKVQGDDTVKDRTLNGLKKIDDDGTKIEYIQINFGVLWCLMF